MDGYWAAQVTLLGEAVVEVVVSGAGMHSRLYGGAGATAGGFGVATCLIICSAGARII